MNEEEFDDSEDYEAQAEEFLDTLFTIPPKEGVVLNMKPAKPALNQVGALAAAAIMLSITGVLMLLCAWAALSIWGNL